MKQGDILLIHSRFDPIAWLIRIITKSQWNHVAWALHNLVLIEITSTGTKTVFLSKYINPFFYKLKLIRFKYLSEEQINRISQNLLMIQDYKISFLKFYLSLFLALLGIKSHLINCAGIIDLLLKQEGYFLKRKNRKFVTPEDFNSCVDVIDVSEELPIKWY